MNLKGLIIVIAVVIIILIAFRGRLRQGLRQRLRWWFRTSMRELVWGHLTLALSPRRGSPDASVCFKPWFRGRMLFNSVIGLYGWLGFNRMSPVFTFGAPSGVRPFTLRVV